MKKSTVSCRFACAVCFTLRAKKKKKKKKGLQKDIGKELIIVLNFDLVPLSETVHGDVL